MLIANKKKEKNQRFLTCNKKLLFCSFMSLHCLKSPSCPNDAEIVGNPKADVIDLTVSDATPVMVVSKTRWGDWFLVIKSE